jgi:hypothetical protein
MAHPSRDDRPLLERLEEYRDSLGFMAPQLESIIDRLPPGSDPSALKDAMKFYSEVANDLTRLLKGERLEKFLIEGEIPQ